MRTGSLMGYFSCVSGLEMTAARVASLPVPEVVGIATSDGDQRGEFLHDAQDAFHLGDGFAGTGDACADALCAVHGRAAAESDDDVALVVVVELETLFDVGDGGVGDDLVIDGDVQPFRLEAVDDGLRHAEAHEPLVGDEQDLLRDAPGQEKHGDVHHLLKTSAIQFVKCIHCC